VSEAIRTEEDRERVIKLLRARELPCTVSMAKGAPRSIEQNKLQRKWMLELQEQGDQTAEEYRAYCKLHFGIPILRAESDEFKEKYDRLIRPLDYEVKLEYMKVPFDFPVTRIMTTKQTTTYLDNIYNFYSSNGLMLTVPDRG
jgi:hypothetical protein